MWRVLFVGGSLFADWATGCYVRCGCIGSPAFCSFRPATGKTKKQENHYNHNGRNNQKPNQWTTTPHEIAHVTYWTLIKLQ